MLTDPVGARWILVENAENATVDLLNVSA